jgi:hypothetical protein
MRRFLFAMCVFTPSTASLSAEDDNNVRSVVVELKMQIADLKAQIATKEAALAEATSDYTAADAEWRNIENDNKLRVNVIKGSMVIALAAAQATEKTREAAEAQFRKVMLATEITYNGALIKTGLARAVVDELKCDLTTTRLDLVKALLTLQAISKK